MDLDDVDGCNLARVQPAPYRRKQNYPSDGGYGGKFIQKLAFDKRF
jgi:hypothetical protein